MKKIYDCCIVGTSPIALLMAFKFLKDKKKIVIIEKKTDYGGAWSNETADHLCANKVETTCHLIEHFTGVYEKISKLSGIQFTRCNPQPVKLINNKMYPYFSPSHILMELLIIIAKILIFPFFRLYKVASPMKIKRGQNLNFVTLLKRFMFLITYKIPSIFTYNGIMEPSIGFSKFVDQMVNDLKGLGVIFIHDCFMDVYQSTSTEPLVIRLSRGNLKSRKIYLSESVDICKESTFAKTLKTNLSIKKTPYWHILIEVFGCTLDSIPSYIHFPEDKFFHRLSIDKVFINQNDKFFLLLQLRVNPNDLNQKFIIEHVRKILLMFVSKVDSDDICIRKTFEDFFYASAKDAYLTGSKITEQICVIPSIGDLARNVATNPLFK